MAKTRVRLKSSVTAKPVAPNLAGPNTKLAPHIQAKKELYDLKDALTDGKVTREEYEKFYPPLAKKLFEVQEKNGFELGMDAIRENYYTPPDDIDPTAKNLLGPLPNSGAQSAQQAAQPQVAQAATQTAQPQVAQAVHPMAQMMAQAAPPTPQPAIPTAQPAQPQPTLPNTNSAYWDVRIPKPSFGKLIKGGSQMLGGMGLAGATLVGANALYKLLGTQPPDERTLKEKLDSDPIFNYDPSARKR